MFISDLFSLEGQVAVVIGGGGVLSGAIAEGFAQAGARVVIVGRTPEKTEARVESIRNLGQRAVGVNGDMSRKADLERALHETMQAYGRVDILLNGAGINSATPFFDISEEEWHKIIDVDLTSVFFACQVFGKAMVESGNGGSIINISSASSDPPLSRVFTYSVAKGGVNQLTKFLARELAPHRVRVNAILPGFFPAEQNRKLLTADRTEAIMRHTPMARFGDADELVATAIYLASAKASSFVTGAIVRVDGGFGAMTI